MEGIPGMGLEADAAGLVEVVKRDIDDAGSDEVDSNRDDDWTCPWEEFGRADAGLGDVPALETLRAEGKLVDGLPGPAMEVDAVGRVEVVN